MRKEVTLAIFFGTIIGLTVAYGVWKAAYSISNQPNTQTQTQPKDNPQPPKKTDQTKLEVLSPENGSVSLSSEIDIQGIYQPNSTIIVSTQDNDYYSTTTGTGEFKIPIDLIGGINLINIFSIKDGQTTKTQALIIHTTEIDTSSPQEKASLTSTNGTITDISETAIQIRSEDGQINQVSTNGDTTYANIINSSKKIGFTDLAIGDFIVAIGTKNEEKILMSKRILVTSPPQEPNTDIKTGTIESYKKPILTLADGTEIDLSKSDIYSVNSNNQVQKTTSKVLTKGSQVTSTGRTIFVLQ